MKVILNADVPGLGAIGNVVNVKDGYARNYLIPKKLAVTATTRNMKELEHMKAVIDAKRRSEKLAAEELAKKVAKTQVQIVAKVGEEQRLYGSVTAAMIAEKLAEAGLDIDKRKIVLVEPIRTTGLFTVPVKVHTEITSEIKVWVKADESDEVAPPAPAAAPTPTGAPVTFEDDEPKAETPEESAE
ncbi:MAG TPA: 50S ribosomal protein L9 [bacterium]|nr:50S ribosomal protein L9 [bacterium]